MGSRLVGVFKRLRGPALTPQQVQAILAAARRRALLDAANEIPIPEAATWLRQRAENQ